jgi:hypothetical protein
VTWPASLVGSRGNHGLDALEQLADGTPVMPPLHLPESVRAVTIHGIVIVTAAGADIAVHQPVLPRAMR